MHARSLLKALISLFPLCIAGCRERTPPTVVLNPQTVHRMQDNYNIALQSGIHGQLYPGQFNRLFPQADNVISYYSGEAGQPRWTSSVGEFGRYVFRMTVLVDFDAARTNIVSTGKPSFYLYEILSIGTTPNGRPYLNINQLTKDPLSSSSWRHLLESKGDFSVLGFSLKTNAPVSGFESFWRSF
jgi:hypothetical protein